MDLASLPKSPLRLGAPAGVKVGPTRLRQAASEG